MLWGPMGRGGINIQNSNLAFQVLGYEADAQDRPGFNIIFPGSEVVRSRSPSIWDVVF